MAYQREKREQRDLAIERIRLLFSQAARLASSDVDAACRRVKMAWNIATRCNTRIPRDLKLRFCRKCLTYFTTRTCRRRLNPDHKRVELTCLRCGRVKYAPYRRKD